MSDIILVRDLTKTLGRSRRIREDNINIDLNEVKWEDMDWSHQAMNREEWRPLVNRIVK
jgi:hypothetical protein